MKRFTVMGVVAMMGCGSPTPTPSSTPTQSESESPAPTLSQPSTPTPSSTPTQSPTADSGGKRHHKIGSGWFLAGTAKEAYAAELDDQVRDGATLGVAVRPTGDGHNQYVSLLKNVAAEPYVGKKVRVTLRVKTDGLTARAEAWARAQAPDSPTDGPGLGSASTKLDPTTADMKTYTLDLEVKSGTRFVQYGVGIAGPGKFWVGHDQIDVVP